MMSESKVTKVTRNGNIDGLDATVTFEQAENSPPEQIHITLSKAKNNFYANAHYDIARKNFSVNANDFPFAKQAFTVIVEQIEGVMSEFEDTKK